MDTSALRTAFVDSLRQNANISDAAILHAFSVVPREKFVGPGPWKYLPASLDSDYLSTPDADPRHLYQDILIALDPERHLNNGLPSWLARAMQHARVSEGESVIHIGCGVGFYTAILAEIVGPRGHVLGIEVDEQLARRAIANLANYSHVKAIHGNGSAHLLSPADVIFVNAGATHLQPQWIENLKPGGRLLVPLTYAREEPGQLLRVTREEGRYRAEFVEKVFMYPCVGSRSDSYADALRKSVAKQGWNFFGELRFDPQNADDSCWLKTDRLWFSSSR